MTQSMRHRHKIKKAPQWQRRLVLILGGLSGATILLVVVWAVLLFLG
jgi:hypothetical protein